MKKNHLVTEQLPIQIFISLRNLIFGWGLGSTTPTGLVRVQTKGVAKRGPPDARYLSLSFVEGK